MTFEPEILSNGCLRGNPLIRLIGCIACQRCETLGLISTSVAFTSSHGHYYCLISMVCVLNLAGIQKLFTKLSKLQNSKMSQ